MNSIEREMMIRHSDLKDRIAKQINACLADDRLTPTMALCNIAAMLHNTGVDIDLPALYAKNWGEIADNVV